MLPTLVTAAGGDVSAFPHDGHDVMPFLKGQATDDPNKVRFWRHYDSFAVLKGEWKLTRPVINTPDFMPWLFNVETDPEERFFVQGAHPDIVAELSRELTAWEVTLAKAKWGALGTLNQNVFDHFVFRNEVSAVANWSAANNWKQGGTNNNATLKRADAYANAILEFRVANDTDFTATNDMQRQTSFTFMLNELRLTGDFTGAASRQGLINGNAVLFVKSLSGALPQIRLDATSNGINSSFAFEIDNELQLYHDLEITGDGTANFVINGRIRDYYEPQQPNITTPHAVRKSGASHVTLRGNNTFTGLFTVEQGQILLDGPSAAVNGAAGIDIKSGAEFTLQSGMVAVGWINIDAGGTFHFHGGQLKVVDFNGDLTNAGGLFSPGASPKISTVSGDFTQQSGTTLIEIGGASAGSQFDTLLVGGAASLGGILDIDLLNSFVPSAGQTFQVLTSVAGVSGVFSQTQLPALANGLFWNVLYGQHSVILAVAPTASLTSIPGDFNLDGTVDASDYTFWRDRVGTSSAAADANFDGQVTAQDYQLWKAHYGYSLTGGGFAAVVEAAVPEAGLAAAICPIVGIWLLFSSRSKRRWRIGLSWVLAAQGGVARA
jgi:autotransporter-associated beta strand protein